MRESFIFYKNWADSIELLPKNQQLDMYKSITNYALDDKEPELTGTAKVIFELVKPIVDANNRRYKNGVKGGRPKEEDSPKKEIEGIELTILTESQYQKLCDKYGEAVTDKAIEIFDNWLCKRSKTAKQYIGSNHYMHFKNDSWAVAQAKEQVLGTQPNWGI